MFHNTPPRNHNPRIVHPVPYARFPAHAIAPREPGQFTAEAHFRGAGLAPIFVTIDADSQTPELCLGGNTGPKHRPVSDLNPRQRGDHGLEKGRPVVDQQRLRKV